MRQEEKKKLIAQKKKNNHIIVGDTELRNKMFKPVTGGDSELKKSRKSCWIRGLQCSVKKKDKLLFFKCILQTTFFRVLHLIIKRVTASRPSSHARALVEAIYNACILLLTSSLDLKHQESPMLSVVLSLSCNYIKNSTNDDEEKVKQ